MPKTKKWSYSALFLALILTLNSAIVVSAASAQDAVVGNEHFQAMLKEYPNLYNAEKGVTQSAFRVSEAICEDVWIEVPVDTDNDGQRDLIRAKIARPKGSGSGIGEVKVPVLLEHSPYRGNTSGTVGGDVQWIFNVNQEQTLVADQPNGDTGSYTYSDVQSPKMRAHEWPWSDNAYTGGGYTIPASRGAKPVATPNTITNILGTGSTVGISINTYMFTRGCAVIYSSGLGNRYTDTRDSALGITDNWNEGLSNTSDTVETVCAMAVIQWLNGEARGYKDKTAQQEVLATEWCNGDVAMSGQSYVATIPIAVASSGIDALKAIIPRAGIVLWYEYFRANGGVFPGEQAQGEDAAWLARYVLGRWNQPGFDRTLYDSQMKKMEEDMDRITGDYNQFWDTGNYLATADQFKAGILFQQGFDDRNVGTQNMDQLYRALKELDPDYPIKLQLHLQAHTTIFNMGPPDILGVSHKWLDYFLYGIENGIVDNGVDAYIADNVTGTWKEYASWPAPGSEMRKYYLGTSASGSGKLLKDIPAASKAGPFYDQLKYRVVEDIRDNPNDPYYNRNIGTDHYNIQQALGDAWEDSMLDYKNIDLPSNARLAYVSDPLKEDLILSGSAKVTLNVTPDKGKGTLSCAIVDIGQARRNWTVNTAYDTIPADTVGGLNAYNRIQYGFNNTITNYKFVARASVDVQNPNPSGVTYLDTGITKNSAFVAPFIYQTKDITPNTQQTYSFTLEPRHYTFRAGSRLAVIVYSTDYRHSIKPLDVTKFTLNLGEGSYIELPLLSPLEESQAEREEILNVTTNANNIKKGEYFSVDTSFTKQVSSNAAVIAYTFDEDKFDYRGCTPADGVTVLNTEVNKGTVYFTVMIDDYKAKDLVSVLFSAKEDASLQNAENVISVGVQYVLKDENDVKTVEYAYGSTIVSTFEDPFEGKTVTLIDLSNIIDIFGYNKSTTGWNQLYKQYDFDGDGEITIADIVHVAKLIEL